VSTYDVLLRGGTLVRPSGTECADIAVADGRIAACTPHLTGTAREEIDARGLHIFPGAIDAHLHFNEPGRSDWEGFATGTRALAAGGTTLFFDMPLNAHPPTLDGASFSLKLAAARASSLVDFAFWGGLVPGNLDKLDELADRGVVGLKAFMANSGIDDFTMADDATLLAGMQRAAMLGLLVAVHAENDALTSALAADAKAQGRVGVRDFLGSRPVIAELEAIQRAILYADETGCRLHIVHVSTGRGVAAVAEARARGVDVTCETCPHYLVLTEDDVERLGAVAKCAPPLRPAAEREALWRALEAGQIAFVASDHSPAPPDMKTGSDFFAIWGGISGCQHLFPLLLSEGHHGRGLAMERVAALVAEGVAQRFGLPPSKGRIEVGADADLALVDLAGNTDVAAASLRYRHRHSPYVGRRLHGRIVRTLVRGRTIYRDGAIVGEPGGEYVRPVAHVPVVR
jgi:allantoinase